MRLKEGRSRTERRAFTFSARLPLAACTALLALAFGCTRRPKPAGDYGSKVDTAGIKVSHDANRTIWKIPYAETWESDKADLFKVVIEDFRKHIDALNDKIAANAAKAIPSTDAIADKLARSEDLQSAIERILSAARSDKALESRFRSALDPGYEARFGKVRELSSVQSYFIPQAFMAVVDMRLAGAVGLGAGSTFALLWAFQPYVTVSIDNRTGKTIDQSFEVDSEIFGVPGGEVACGVGGSASPHFGIGAIFGPLKNPADLAGLGIKIGGNFTLPVVGSITGRLVTLLKFPPLFYAVGSYGPGVGAEGTCPGGVEAILSVESLLKRFQPGGGIQQQQSR